VETRRFDLRDKFRCSKRKVESQIANLTLNHLKLPNAGAAAAACHILFLRVSASTPHCTLDMSIELSVKSGD